MTATPVTDGPCWILNYQADQYDVIPHYATELEALRRLAWEINEAVDDLRRDEGPRRPRRSAMAMVAADEDYAHLLVTAPQREKEPCVEVRCDGCTDEAEWDDDWATHTFLSELDNMIAALDWSNLGTKHYCCYCPVPDDVVHEHDENLRRAPGPDDVPLFDLSEAG